MLNTKSSSALVSGAYSGGMVEVELIRPTVVDGHHVEAGVVIIVPRHEAEFLIGYGIARKATAKPVGDPDPTDAVVNRNESKRLKKR